MAKFFTADPHFFHDGIRHSCGRPFDDVAEMNAALMERWNETVGPTDDVFVIGDFALRTGKARLLEVFEALNGHKRLVPGNHDHKPVRKLPWTEILPNNVEIEDGGETFVLNHYPMLTWNKKRYGYRHLYGHVHAAIPGTSLSLDVGVDAWGFRPVSTPRILAAMAKFPPYVPYDDGPRVSFVDDEEPEWSGPRP